MADYIFTPENGVIIPDTGDIKTDIQNEFTQAFSDIGVLSLEDSTPQGRLIDMETTARSSVITFNAEIANVLINIAMSAGLALDAWGANFDIPRNGESASSVPVTVGGVADTIITAGSQALDVNGLVWTSENEIIIGSNGTATGVFVCSNVGPVELATGELNKIVASGTTGIDGWETITNTAAATLGNYKESDASYKRRILTGIFNGTALFGNYASVCYKVDGVRDVYTYDNPYGTARQLDTISIPAHSVYVCVDGGNASDIAYALYEAKSAGCGWCGNTTVSVIDKVYNTINSVTFQIPTSLNFVIDVAATSVLTANTDLKTEIKTVIVNYFSNIYENNGFAKVGIRAIIDPFIIATAVQSQISGIEINSVKVGLKTPAIHATATILKASVTSGIQWASVTDSTFANAVNNINGKYIFEYDGSGWKLDDTSVSLSTYGVSVIGTPVENDKIFILFATGQKAIAPIQIYADEIAAISEDDITVSINE